MFPSCVLLNTDFQGVWFPLLHDNDCHSNPLGNHLFNIPASQTSCRGPTDEIADGTGSEITFPTLARNLRIDLLCFPQYSVGSIYKTNTQFYFKALKRLHDTMRYGRPQEIHGASLWVLLRSLQCSSLS